MEMEMEMDPASGREGPDGDRIDPGRKQDLPPDDDVCPICFGDFTVPCKTACGHWYCGEFFGPLLSFSPRMRCEQSYRSRTRL